MGFSLHASMFPLGQGEGILRHVGPGGRGALLVGTDFVSPKAVSPMFQNCVFKRF